MSFTGRTAERHAEADGDGIGGFGRCPSEHGCRSGNGEGAGDASPV
jgi:hypothetical protein